MQNKRKILITNDDGITSDGIIRLTRAAVKFGEVWVVAPESQRSAMSHSITLRHEFHAWPVDFPVPGVHAYACDGTPGDCVRVGVLNIVPEGPDVVFSGINFGYNCATDLQYSATAGAAFEAVFQGVRAIAFSEGANGLHETTDDYLETVMAELIDAPLPQDHIWNVNFPECKSEECKGIQRNVRTSRSSIFKDRYNEKRSEDGMIEFRVNGIYTPSADEGTDLRALLDCYVAIGTVGNVGSRQ